MCTSKPLRLEPQQRAAIAPRQLGRLLLGTLAIACSLCALDANAAFASGELPSVWGENAGPWSVTTEGTVTESGAFLDATVSPNGSDTTLVYSYGPTLEYGTDVEPTGGTIAGANTAADEPVYLPGLKPGTRYYYEVRATNSAGTVTSANATFRTPPGELPSAETVSGGTSADLTFSEGAAWNTYLQPAGLSAANAYPEDTTWPAETEIGPTVARTETLSGFSLTETNSSSSDLVMARLLANGVGDGPACIVEGSGSCSSDASETMTVHPGDHLAVEVQDVGSGECICIQSTDTVSATFSYHVDNLLSPELLEVSTGTVTPTETEVDAEVAPEGTDTLFHIEYGPEVPSEFTAPIENLEVGKELEAIEEIEAEEGLARPARASLSTPAAEAEPAQRRRVTQTLTGLTPGQTYHYRVIATNAGGTTTSPEWTFQANGAGTHPRGPSPSGGPPGEKESGHGTSADGGSGGGDDSPGGAASTTYSRSIAGRATAQIIALLRRDLFPSHVGASVAALLRHGSLALPFRAPAAGRLLLDWYEAPPRIRLAGRSASTPILVASGQVTFTAAGGRGLRLKLTAPGRRLLEHARRSRLTAKATFTPSGGAPVVQTTDFMVRR